MNVRARIKLCDATRIQDIGLLDREGEVESIIVSIYSPNESVTAAEVLKRATNLDNAKIEVLERSLASKQTDIGKIILHLTLWLNLKNKGISHLQSTLGLLSEYYGTFSLERDIKEELYTYRFLHNLFYYLPLLVKPSELAAIRELMTFLSAYEKNATKVIAEIFKSEDVIHPNAPFWLLKPLLTFYCSKKSIAPDKSKFKQLIELLLDNYIAKKDVHWAKNVLEDFEDCFDKAEIIALKKKVATLYFNAGMEFAGLQAIGFLRIAATMFQQMDDHMNMDAALGAMKKKEMTIDWKISESALPAGSQEKISQQVADVTERLEQLSKEEVRCADLLVYLFNNHLLPSKGSIEKQSDNMPITYVITTVTPMTEGRSGVLTTEEEKKEHWKATLLNRMLFTYSFYQIYKILEWFIEKYGVEGLEECLTYIYQQSTVYDERREALVISVIKKYFADDVIGFVYSVIPQIEHSLKMLLESVGISVRERDIKYLEEINLNTILSNYKQNLIDILGEDFYEVLWLCFQYDFGLNIRNSVLHGGGLTYLSKQYALLLFFILEFIFYRSYDLQLSITGDEGDSR
ncbi:MAG: DUF4209 domain-containing protein [Thermodesulfobacteriota bacterium]